MPTITTVDATWDTGVTMDAAELRRADSAMFLGDGSANGVRGGVVRHGDTSLAVSVNGSDQVTVQPGAFVVPAATGLGVYRGSLSGVTSAVALSARNATNPRIDLIVVQVTGTNATVKTIDGTPGSSPSAPALPAQHIELARVTVPATGGGAVTVDSTWRSYATGIGGALFVETSARLPGSGNQKGQRAVALDTGLTHKWDGTAWENGDPGSPWIAYGTPTTVLTAATSNPTLGTGSSATAAYMRTGKLVHFRIEVVSGSSGTAAGSGQYQFLLPATPRASIIAPLGHGVIQAGAGGVVEHYAPLMWVSGTVANLFPPGSSSASSTFHNVLANRRYLISGTYEAA